MSDSPTRIIALDTETTGLDPYVDEAFEIAIVVIDPGTGRDARGDEYVWTIEPSRTALEAMHPEAAKVNRYPERTAAADWQWTVERGESLESTLNDIAAAIGRAHIVGAVPDFDTRFLEHLFRMKGYDKPEWHHHLIDVEVLALGWLRAAGVRVAPPYKSDELSTLCGIAPPGPEERHTALGDALWVARWYRALMAEIR